LKVVGLFGSPRRGGNTDLLLEEALKGAEMERAEVERFHLSDFHIIPCTECLNCYQKGECIILDDMQKIYPKLLEADAIILASPIFFYGVTAWAKALIDRCQALWARKYLLGRPIGRPGQKRLGIFIAAGGTNRPYTFRPSITIVKTFFATLDVGYYRELLYGSVDAKGDILQHASALEEAFKAGVDMVEALAAREAAARQRSSA